jgi:hypothetical protein
MTFVLNTLTFPSHLKFTPMQMDLQLEGCYSPLNLRELMKGQLRWLIHEKKLFDIMVNCFKTWQQYLKSQTTKVFMNNVSLWYFETQQKATAKYLHWHNI